MTLSVCFRFELTFIEPSSFIDIQTDSFSFCDCIRLSFKKDLKMGKSRIIDEMRLDDGKPQCVVAFHLFGPLKNVFFQLCLKKWIYFY